MQNIYMVKEERKMEFKWKVNANVSYLHSSYPNKKLLSETFFSFYSSISYDGFDFIAKL